LNLGVYAWDRKIVGSVEQIGFSLGVEVV
jgi:hypothetical protein